MEEPVAKDDTRMSLIGKKWVLVVNDEIDMRTDTRRVLDNAGYGAYFAGSCDDAVECYKTAREYGYPFAAVILDAAAVDGAAGRDTVRRLLDLDPNVKAIIAGSDRECPVIKNFREHGFQGVLAKPFTGEELVHILDGERYDVRGAA
jgi:two-component system cell cycle sensor histidine kinase/response regulator CckA